MLIDPIHMMLPEELQLQIFHDAVQSDASLVCKKWHETISKIRVPRVVKSLKKFNKARMMMLGEKPEHAFLEGFENVEGLFRRILADNKALDEDPENALRAICDRETRLVQYLLFKRLFEYHPLKPKGALRHIWTWFGGEPIDQSRLADISYLNEVIEANVESLCRRKMLDIYEDRLPQYCLSHYFFPKKFALFQNLKSLKITMVSGKPFRLHLKSIPRQIFSFSNLQHLALRFHEIPKLPESLGNLVQLRSLQLNSNQIETLPKNLSKLIHLQHLELEGNNLSALPVEIGALSELAVAWFSNNRIERIPEEMGECRKLKFLKLKKNRIAEIPDSFSRLTELVCLNLLKNPVTSLPGKVLSLRSLDYISLDLRVITGELQESVRAKAMRVFNEDLTFEWWDYEVYEEGDTA